MAEARLVRAVEWLVDDLDVLFDSTSPLSVLPGLGSMGMIDRLASKYGSIIEGSISLSRVVVYEDLSLTNLPQVSVAGRL